MHNINFFEADDSGPASVEPGDRVESLDSTDRLTAAAYDRSRQIVSDGFPEQVTGRPSRAEVTPTPPGANLITPPAGNVSAHTDGGSVRAALTSGAVATRALLAERRRRPESSRVTALDGRTGLRGIGRAVIEVEAERHELRPVTSTADRLRQLEAVPSARVVTDTSPGATPMREFSGDELRIVREPLAILGLPLGNITEFARAGERTQADASDSSGEGKMTTLASMVMGGEHKGRMTVHDAYFTRDTEERAAVVVHEQIHSLSPLLEDNDEVYGGTEERLKAIDRVEGIVQQSLLTGVHLNGYHKHLLAEYKQAEAKRATGESSDDDLKSAYIKLVEETSAIATEMSIFDRGGLQVAQEMQYRKMDDLARIAKRSGGVPAKVALLTDPKTRGRQGAGADVTTMRLLQGAGVEDYEGFMQHIASAKAALNWGSRSKRYAQNQALAA